MTTGRNAKKAPLHIETVAALLLLVTMAALTVLLVSSTGSSYTHIVRTGAAGQELRTGLSFVSTKVRQSDAGAGSVRVQGSPFGGGALVLSSAEGGTVYEEWIFFYRGTLREVLIPRGTAINPSACTTVSTLSTVRFSLEGRELTVTAAAAGGGSRSLTLTLRS